YLMAFDLYQTLSHLATNCNSQSLRNRASQHFERMLRDLCVELQQSQLGLISNTVDRGDLASIELSTKFVLKPDCVCPIIEKIQIELDKFLKTEKEKASKSKVDMQSDMNALQTTIRNFKQNGTLLCNFVRKPERNLTF